MMIQALIKARVYLCDIAGQLGSLLERCGGPSNAEAQLGPLVAFVVEGGSLPAVRVAVPVGNAARLALDDPAIRVRDVVDATVCSGVPREGEDEREQHGDDQHASC
jgi:hypothetical protein